MVFGTKEAATHIISRCEAVAAALPTGEASARHCGGARQEDMEGRKPAEERAPEGTQGMATLDEITVRFAMIGRGNFPTLPGQPAAGKGSVEKLLYRKLARFNFDKLIIFRCKLFGDIMIFRLRNLI